MTVSIAGMALLALTVGSPDSGLRIAEAAMERTEHTVTYDPAYHRIDYPGGDVAPDRGVCADVIVRALRQLGFDLQVEVHEDMKAAFSAYPAHWGLTRPDPNIDHRRVPNLEVFFTRQGWREPISDRSADYRPGDIVSWNLRGASGGWLPHIGIVTAQTAASGRPLVVHNIGRGPQAEDVLFDWPQTGHFRASLPAAGNDR
ncbi:DUF1287 domain-containing protein [Parvularcula sp. LCG005]|uniref:DUF1287 domain-containing protein n=1 Tax=Parvularcula sp. LCG005 TaxID=3078805 RepID=UPI0029425F6F|nr:DUF1287 domain-containing protein [Parvularcula sp. LCG005]WOI53851.1 DUF1287 domain-containing protein [Parvularcula sp. LCG005]